MITFFFFFVEKPKHQENNREKDAAYNMVTKPHLLYSSEE